MNIKKVEEATGISKQNIRFYEKHGLVQPQRNKENEYREYSENDIRILKIVKILRKLGMPLEEIKRILEEAKPFSEAVKEHQEKLQKEEEKLQAAISFCKVLENDTIERMDADLRLQEMENEEERGNVFMSIVNDIIKIDKEEGIKRFSFSPNSLITNPRQFTEELLHYANENNMDIVIIKESMYPEFEIGGVEYQADRFFTRFGAVVECHAKNEEQVEGEETSKKSRKIIKIVLKIWPMLILGVLLFCSKIGDTAGMVTAVLFTVVMSVVWGASMYLLPKR